MINWIVSSTVLIVLIICLRLLLKGKISLRLQYGLWAIVLVRLLIPFSLGETVFSVGNWMEKLSQKEEVYEVYEFTQVKLPEMSYQQAYQKVAERYESQGVDIQAISEQEFAETIEYEIQETMTGDLSLADIAKKAWGIGSIVVGFWFLFTNVFFYQKVLKSRRAFFLNDEAMASDTKALFDESKKRLKIYRCDEVDTPCLFGLFSPAIYVPSEATKDEEVLRHVIAHETTHYLHRDYIWGYLRALCLAIHWYNPFVWCAAFLSRNDAELACDEVTIARLGETQRASYGRTLIVLTCEKPVAVLLTATTMTGSGKAIKERISLIARRPKMKRYTLIAVILIAILCVGCTFTGAKDDKNNNMSEGTESELSAVTGIDSLTNNKIIFYDVLSQYPLITDEEINSRVLQLLLDENHLIDTIEWKCEIDLEQSVEVDGCPYYRVLEADSWSYYEEIARDYYSEEFFKKNFEKKYIEEYELFVEVDGKLYRAAAGGEVPVYLKDSLEVWKVDEDTYYATMKIFYSGLASGGWFETRGYQLCLSENSSYGFEIVDKPYVQTNAKEFTHYADLTHDGVDECIKVSIIGESAQEDTVLRIQVYDEATSDLLYEKSIQPHTKLAQWYYLNTYNNQDYLMLEEIDRTTEETIYKYELFYLSESGEEILYDFDEVYVSPTSIAAWKSYAKQTSRYFEGGTLLIGTYGLRLEYSTNIKTEPYYEELMWLLQEDDLERVAKDLDVFLEGILDD